MRSTTKFCVERYQKSSEPFHPLQLLFMFLTSVFLPESSYLIGQFAGIVHYFYVTDDGRFSNLHKWFSNQKKKLLVPVGLMTNHDYFFS